MDEQTYLLRAFADNDTLVAAVRSVIEKQFTLDAIGTHLSNEIIGQHARARLEGLKKVGEAFREIATHKSTEKSKETQNPAR